MKYVVGVDIGGSKIDAALLRNWKIIKKIKKCVSASMGKEVFLKNLFEMIGYAIAGIDKKNVSGIGIAVPGAIYHKEGKILLNIKVKGKKGWEIDLKRLVQKRFGLETFLENDANAFALAELKFGIGRKAENFVLLTLGSGIGGALVFDKKLYVGNDAAGEMGHMVIVKDGLKCNCGRRGCLEEYVSIRAFERLSKKYFGKKLDPRIIFERAKKGDKTAKKIYEEIGEYLGVGLANIVNILDPEMIIIGGGISGAGEFILKPTKRKMKQSVFSNKSQTKIVLSKLENAGILGAASLVK